MKTKPRFCQHCGKIGQVQFVALAWPDGYALEVLLHPICEEAFAQTKEAMRTGGNHGR